jgi:hypothetical protein
VILYTCPDEMDIRELSTLERDYFTIFLAGGITNCPDWQKELIEKLKDVNVILFNPRRAEKFDPNDHKTHEEQVAWEWKYLQQADYVSFWFPCETLCPITLFELGAACEREHEGKQSIFVGAHPDYAKLETVKYQLHKYMALDEPLATTINELADQITNIIC